MKDGWRDGVKKNAFKLENEALNKDETSNTVDDVAYNIN